MESDSCGVGFVASIDGVASNKVRLCVHIIRYAFTQILTDSRTMLERMEHRGACSCDNDSGDGAGVMTAIPHKLYADELR
jgi:glutamate synthase (NADPH/NADH)